MDILDIDEVLKDDSFCLIEEESEQDDINNILRQWRQNGCTGPNGPDGKLDTRTFTRPKRRSAQNLDPNFALASRSADNTGSNIHLKVGGLVTSQMQKSFLMDTSPPSSISSSVDASSIDRMGNSLITSGDFTNVSFFKTTDVEDVLSGAQIAGYNFDNVIEDCKTLERLSLSGDSAIIKDCNIAQIDEITYLSKTNSGNSTMHNSTESTASCLNDTFSMLNQTAIENGVALSESDTLQSKNGLNETFINKTVNMPLDDLICNTTMTLIDSTHIVQTAAPETEGNANATFGKDNIETHNETFSKKDILNSTFNNPNGCPSTIMNRTYYKELDGNKTFDLLESSGTNVLEDDGNFDSPVELPPIKMNGTIQSTPHRNVSSVLPSSLVSQTPSMKRIIQDVNISPIVPARNNEVLDDDFQLLDETKPYTDASIDQLERYLESLSGNFPNTQEQIENFKTEKVLQNDSFTKQECFENGMELLADEKNEEEFDDLLEKLGRSSCLEDSIKMRQSIHNIKKKHALLSLEKGHDLTWKSSDSSVDLNRLPSDSMCKSSLSASSSSERLLSRRSRLYDDVQVMKSGSESANKTIIVDDSKKAIAKTDPSTVSNSSYTVESKTEMTSPVETVEDSGKGVEAAKNAKTKLERNRDPERFKTIRIFKKSTDSEIVVPCIDSEIEGNDQNIEQDQNVDTTNSEQPVEVHSTNTTITVFNNNKSEMEPNIMYQTYKKPKSLMKPPSINEQATFQTTNRELPKPRSLSRPKYFSGIARRDPDFSADALPKANSAGDIHKTYNNANTTGNHYANGATSGMRKLSSNLGGGNGSYGISSANRLSIAKPSSQPSLLTQTSGNVANYKEKNDRPQLSSRQTTMKTLQNDVVEKDGKSQFKVPPPVSSLRAANSRRTGLVRPSSGFYGQAVVKSDPDIQSGRYSSNNSLSSTSSRGSVQDCQQPAKCTNGYIHEKSTSNEEIRQSLSNNVQAEEVTRVVKTGIPKPSGLRPPSTVRKSGLPRPSSIVRR